jgi:outer membrane protein assembly factor BamB
MNAGIAKPAMLLGLAVGGCILVASDPPGGDWPMWGGSGDRNMASSMSGIPTNWDIKTGKNVKWVAKLGSQTYGNPVVAGGQVYVGTNGAAGRDPKENGYRGVLMCFRESDGRFLWQHTNEKLDRKIDFPETGVCSSPLVEGERLYYLSNRCELVCLDTRGDGKGGAKVVWKLDLIKELGVYPHNESSSSPASYGDLIFVGTSNGRDDNNQRVPAPGAPSMVAVNKNTGKLAWQAAGPGVKILEGQWSSPAVGAVGGVVQVAIGEGDGWVRSYEALSGKLLWEFDTNPKDATWPKTRNEVVATPVIWRSKVYVANGQGPTNGPGPGHVYAIDATKRGDITASGRIWRYDGIQRSVSTAAIANGLLFIADTTGYLHCLDAITGKPYWTHDLLAAVWGSPMAIGGKVYLGDEDGDVAIFEVSKEKKLIAQPSLGSSVYSTAVPAHGTLFLANRSQLFAIGQRP